MTHTGNITQGIFNICTDSLFSDSIVLFFDTKKTDVIITISVYLQGDINH